MVSVWSSSSGAATGSATMVSVWSSSGSGSATVRIEGMLSAILLTTGLISKALRLNTANNCLKTLGFFWAMVSKNTLSLGAFWCVTTTSSSPVKRRSFSLTTKPSSSRTPVSSSTIASRCEGVSFAPDILDASFSPLMMVTSSDAGYSLVASFLPKPKISLISASIRRSNSAREILIINPLKYYPSS